MLFTFLITIAFIIEKEVSVSAGGTLGANYAVKLKISVDNWYSVYWNGEFNPGLLPPSGWNFVNEYILIPHNECGYENVLAINATGDRQVLDGAIFEVSYGSQLWQSGVSADIQISLPPNDTAHPNCNWFLKAYSDKKVWVDSNTRPQSNMKPEWVDIQNKYFTKGTRWIWWTACNELKISKVYFKLVIPTTCIKKHSCEL